MTGAACTAATALTDDTGHTIVDRNIHYMIAYGPLIRFLAPVGLDKGDIDDVFLCIHHHIITAVEFAWPAG
jgi:hypothetical protein